MPKEFVSFFKFIVYTYTIMFVVAMAVVFTIIFF